MAQVIQPQKENQTAKLLQTGGMIAGGIAGAPAGPMRAAAGATTGAAAGNLAAGFLGGNNQQSPSLQAAQRRIQAPQATVQAPSPLQELEAARMEVAQLPPEQRQQFEAPILAALMQARREGTA